MDSIRFGPLGHRKLHFASRRGFGLGLGWAVALSIAATTTATAATLSDPEVDRFNVRVGTQTFAPKYRFSTNTVLVETAEAIRTMGSDVIKFYLGRGFRTQYGIALPTSIRNLTDLVRDEPSCRRVLDMPFRHYVVWAYAFAADGDAGWKDGYSDGERRREYDEIYALTRYLLGQYDRTGKRFYLGHWEGDWYLLPNYDTSVNPSSTAVQGMIDWLRNRQQAIDDARRDTPHDDVDVFGYTEANRVRDAMVNPPSRNRRLVNAVLPAVTNLDFVSWSAYDGMDLSEAELRATLDYLEAHLPTNKAAVIPGRRVMIGEYGWGGTLSSAAQEPPTRTFLRKVIPWGPRFVLFWEMYDNEGKSYWLIDKNGEKTPCFWLHQRWINQARLRIARFKESRSRLPDDLEFAASVTPILDRPLPAPVALSWSRPELGRLTGAEAVVRSTFEQGVYGDDAAGVEVFWGVRDGGTDPAGWEHRRSLGLHTRFNPTVYTVSLTNLVSGTNYFYRFRATNIADEAWSPTTGTFTTDSADPPNAGRGLRITATGADTLRLAWPIDSESWVLDMTTDLRPPVRWVEVTSEPTRAESEWQLAIRAAEERARFFRLREEPPGADTGSRPVP